MSTTAPDYRLDWILRKGDTIQTADATYTITGEPIGLGGSSVLYPASKSGSHLDYAIKECFPATPAVYQRTRGIVQAADPTNDINQNKLAECRKMISKEKEIGQEIRNTTTRAVSVWDELTPVSITTGGENFHEVSDGGFSVLERMDKKGRFFNELLSDICNACPPEDRRTTFGLPSIQLTVQIMEQALRALKQVHDAGYYYGDLSGSNLLLAECDLERNHIGIGHLIDFGSTRKLESDGYTAPIINEPVFSTDGFRPFEIRDRGGAELRLGKQADIYSAGCLFLRCVLSPAKIKTLGDSPSAGSNILTEVNGKAVGCTGRALQLVNEILDKATQYYPENRYADASEMLDAVLELKKYTEPPKFLLPSNLSSPDYWVPHSRDKELAILEKAVNDGETVFIHGVGGIGKTECAIQLAKRLNPPRGAYLVHFQNSMKETIMRMNFSGYKYMPNQKGLSLEELEEAEYRERLDILREHYCDTVLIVDNFDADNTTLDELRRESSFKDFLSLDLKRIFTTRYPVGQQDWEIRELSNADLLKMMRYYCTDSSIKDEQFLAILKEIQNHTLTAMLVAKTLEESLGDITPEMILKALQNSKLSQGEYPEVVSDQNRGYQQKKIYDHLKALFDLSPLSNNAKCVLCWATLLPETGMDIQLFKECMVFPKPTFAQRLSAVILRKHQKASEKNILRFLVRCGWLTRSDQMVKIHPIIREVCRGELMPNDKICKSFLAGIIKHYNWKRFDHVIYRQIADCFAMATNSLSKETHVFARVAARLYGELGLLNERLKYNEKALSIVSTNFPEDHDLLASYYNNVGLAHGDLGNYLKQLEYCEKALNLRTAILPANHPDLVTFYSNVGTAYGKLGNYQKALEYSEKALAIQESVPPANNYENYKLAIHYNNIAHFLGDAGDLGQQLEYYEKTLAIQETMLPKDHPDLANTYVSISYAYGNLRNYQKQLEFCEKALAIQETMLPKGHPDLAAAYASISYAYGNLGNYQKQLEFCEKALAIQETVLPKDHPDLVNTYIGLGCAHGKLDNYQKQLEFCEKALAIQETVLPKDHPHLADSYIRIGYAHGELGNHQKQLEFYEKALAIWEIILPENHPKLALTYDNIACAYEDLGDIEKEVIFLRKAAQNGRVTSMNALANHLIDGNHCTQDYSEALHWLEKSHALGNSTGTNNLGWMYLHGVGVTQDLKYAIELFKESANHSQQPSIASNRHLGKIYLGVHPKAPAFDGVDPIKALHYLEQAKKLGATDVDELIQLAKTKIG